MLQLSPVKFKHIADDARERQVIKMIEVDNISTTVVIIAAFTAMYIAFKQFTKKAQTFGPRHLSKAPALPSLPLVGTMPYLPDFSQFHTFFVNKTATYGKVFSLYIGSWYTVILNDRNSLEEAFVKRSLEFADRPDFSDVANPNRLGIADHPYNDEFKRHSQLILNTLKSFGFGRTSTMETRIQTQVQNTIKALRNFGGRAMNPDPVLRVGVVNVIGDILFAKKFEHSDPEAHRVIGLIEHFIYYYTKIMPVRMFPFLRFVPYFRKQLQNFVQATEKLTSFTNERIEECSKDDIDECFVKSFVQHENKELSTFNRRDLMFILRDLLSGGTETSSVTLLWSIVMLANNPNIQRRLQEDIDAVVPADRLPSMDDQPRLPYAEATMLELMRWKTMIMLGVPHMTMTDTEVAGYFVPVGSIVISNLYAIHMDPVEYPNPEQFRPERFLDADGNVFGKKRIVTFSLGKRQCPGQVLAEQQIWLFFTALIQQFDILPPEGRNTIECHEVIGTTTMPSEFQVRFVQRKATNGSNKD